MAHIMKFRLLIVLIILVIFQCESFSTQVPDTAWTKTFGGSNIDIGHCVQPTSDGGYIITGYTRSFGTMSGRNVWLIKTDMFGNLVWQNAYGGNNDDEGYSVQQTTDGGYIITGYTKSFGSGLMDVYIIKTDSSGNEMWSKTFGGAQDDEGYSIQLTNDGGYIIAGATSSFGAGGRDGWLIKVNASGNEVWRKTLGGLSSDGVRCIQQTSDNGFIITGWTYSQGPGIIGNAWLAKTDSLGNQEWSKAFGGTDVDRGYSVQQTSDGGYILTGYTASFGAGLDDMLLIKTDNLGNQSWMKTFGGTGRDYGHEVQQTPDGGYIITGYTLSFGAGGDDVFLVKTDFDGNAEWSKTFGGSSSDVGYSVKVTSDGGYIITGHTLSYGAGIHDVWLIKIDSPVIPVELTSFAASVVSDNVTLIWTTATETNNKGVEVQRKESGDFLTIGFVEGKGTSTSKSEYFFIDSKVMGSNIQYRLKQIDFDGLFNYSNTIEVEIEIPVEFNLSQNYPNPFNPVTRIAYQIPIEGLVKIKIYDLLGSEVTTLVNEVKSAGSYEVFFDAIGLTSGVYFYRLMSGDFIETKKLILQK